MPDGLKRYYGGGHFHFITCCCYHRQPWLNSPQRRDLFVGLLEEARRHYRFVVIGYVVMPEHFHLLISEPEEGDRSKVMQVVKQRFAQRVLGPRRKSTVGHSSMEPPSKHVWQARFYDFNVWSERKRMEKLCYMHCNPVKRGLVTQPERWPWSSSQDYSYGQTGTVQVIDSSVMKMRKRGTAA